MPLPKPILKARFMQKRLAHGIKRTGPKAKVIGKTKNKYVKESTGLKATWSEGVRELYAVQKKIVPLEKHQLKDARFENANNALIKEQKRVRDNAKGKGLIAQREAKEKIIELKRQFIEKYLNDSRINNNRKIRQANIIIEKLEKITAGNTLLFKHDIQKYGVRAADVIIKTYVDYMKANKLNYTELSKQDVITIMHSITSKLPHE